MQASVWSFEDPWCYVIGAGLIGACSLDQTKRIGDGVLHSANTWERGFLLLVGRVSPFYIKHVRWCGECPLISLTSFDGLSSFCFCYRSPSPQLNKKRDCNHLCVSIDISNRDLKSSRTYPMGRKELQLLCLLQSIERLMLRRKWFQLDWNMVHQLIHRESLQVVTPIQRWVPRSPFYWWEKVVEGRCIIHFFFASLFF